MLYSRVSITRTLITRMSPELEQDFWSLHVTAPYKQVSINLNFPYNSNKFQFPTQCRIFIKLWKCRFKQGARVAHRYFLRASLTRRFSLRALTTVKKSVMRFEDKTFVLSSLTLLTLNCIYKLFVNESCVNLL